MKLDIKPLSVNECWMGRRFKTSKYKNYERNLFTVLPKMELPEPPYQLIIEWGFSSSASDIDNPCKPFIDILQKYYGFNDKLIHQLNLSKCKVKKGNEYINFEIKSIN